MLQLWLKWTEDNRACMVVAQAHGHDEGVGFQLGSKMIDLKSEWLDWRPFTCPVAVMV